MKILYKQTSSRDFEKFPDRWYQLLCQELQNEFGDEASEIYDILPYEGIVGPVAGNYLQATAITLAGKVRFTKRWFKYYDTDERHAFEILAHEAYHVYDQPHDKKRFVIDWLAPYIATSIISYLSVAVRKLKIPTFNEVRAGIPQETMAEAFAARVMDVIEADPANPFVRR